MYCRQLHSILDEYLKTHHVVIYQVVLDNEDRTEQENFEIIQKYFEEFYSTPGVFYVKKGAKKSYLNTYTLGITESVIDDRILPLFIRLLSLTGKRHQRVPFAKLKNELS